MDNPLAVVDSLLNNRAKIARYAPVVQLLVGLFLILFGYAIGKDHFQLILHGVRAPGTVVSYKPQGFRDSQRNFTTTAFMPIVQFHAGDRLIEFKDWLGSHSSGVLNKPVTVLYDSVHPNIAMIDRPVWNWIPWGPTIAVGLLLLLSGLRALTRPPTQAS